MIHSDLKLYRYVAILFFHFLQGTAIAQYGHEWIDLNSSYIRIKTYKNGIYYLTKQHLINSGMPSTTDPRSLRLWHRGAEQQLLISGESDGFFDANDTLYFYGQRNNGLLDSSLYTNPQHQPNLFFNLHSDTSVYFLNWKGGSGAARMALPNFSTSTNQVYHKEQCSKYFHENYAFGVVLGETRSSKVDEGEGWTSNSFSNPFTFVLEGIKDIYPTGFNPTIELQIIGRNQYFSNRRVVLKIGNPASPDYEDTLIVSWNYKPTLIEFTLPIEALSATNLSITLEPISDNGANSNLISINYCRLTYPQFINTQTTNSKIYYPFESTLPAATQIGWNTSSPLIFDISNPDSVNLLAFSFDGSQISVYYPQEVDSFLVISRSALMEPSEIISKKFSLPDINSDYYIISNPALKNSVEEYANYRSSTLGGNYKVAIEWTTDLYDLFSYGEFTPVALYQYCKYLITNNSGARFVSFLGKGVDIAFQTEADYYRWNPEKFHHAMEPKSRTRNLVPTSGSPGSDLLYVMNQNLRPKIAVGRIPGKNDTEILHYLEKVKEQEAGGPYDKELIHITGGNSAEQTAVFSEYVDGYKQIVENSPWQGVVIKNLIKTDFSSITSVSISKEVNEGVSFITFYGHSSEMITDPNFGFVSVDSNGFQNKGKYPMLILDGCDAGNVFGDYSLMEDWTMTPDRGAICGIGGSEPMYSFPIKLYTTNLYKQLFENPENIGKSIGEIINHNLNDYTQMTVDEITQTQIVLCGDPAVIIIPASEPLSATIGHENTASTLQLFPNPNNGIFKIESSKEGRIEILNSHGVLLYSSMLKDNKLDIQLNFPPGIYYVRLVESGNQSWKKLVIGG